MMSMLYQLQNKILYYFIALPVIYDPLNGCENSKHAPIVFYDLKHPHTNTIYLEIITRND